MRLIQEGPKSARVLLVGEAPGEREDASGRPFIGGAGQILDRLLGNAGILRQECFITNVCHHRPPKNKFDWFLKTKEGQLHLTRGMLQLKKDIEEIKPNVIVALGAQPLRVLTGETGIDKWRGSILNCVLVPGFKVIGTYHPAFIMRIWDYHAVATFDLERIAREKEYPEIRRPVRDLILDPPKHEHKTLAKELMKADWLAVDIECWMDDQGIWRLACIGYSDRPDRAVCFPTRTADDKLLAMEICGSGVRKVFQNGNNFDIPVLKDNGIIVPLDTFAWDTMIGHHAIFPESASGGDEMTVLGGKKRQAALARGLAFQTSIYTDEPYYKDDGKLWRETDDLEMFWRYNCLDAATTREIRDRQAENITEFGVWPVFRNAMKEAKALMRATERGIAINKETHAELKDKYTTEIIRLQSFMDKAAGSPVNVKSTKQVQELLYGKLGLPPKINPKTGRPTANKDAIVELAAKHPHPVLMSILEIRERRDMIERYLNTAYDNDGRMRCSFDVAGTRSGRLSSRKSISGSGTNLQNIPPAIRRMFEASDGKVFVYRDYSQAEARMVAYLSRSEDLIQLFEDPTRDVHTENAARIFDKPVSDVSHDVERYLAKRIVHACNYGMGARRFTQVINEDADITGVRLSIGDAQRLIDRYFMMFPEIRSIFWKEVEDELKHSRTLTTPFGRKRQFFARWDDKLLREAYSYIPQSSVGDLTRRALVRVDDEISEADFLLNVHDSILEECNPEDVTVVAAKMGEAMNIPIPVKGTDVYIPTDCEVGKNWAHASDDNPDGLMPLEDWLAKHATA